MPSTPDLAPVLWRNRNFVLYLSARILATLAVQMLTVTIGWHVYQLTASLVDLGLVGLFQFAPLFILALAAGHVADRYSRHTIIVVCLTAQLLCSVLLLLYTANDTAVTWPLFAVLILFGAARAFMMPATQAILSSLVPPQNLSQAIALGSSGFHVAKMAGPALGGLFCLLGLVTSYSMVVSLFALSALLMLATRIHLRSHSDQAATWDTVFQGLTFIWSRPVILGALTLDLFAVLLGGATALLPAFAADVLQAGPGSLGLLRSAPGFGALLASLALTLWPISRRVGYWMFGGVALFGLSSIALGLTTQLPSALLALTLMGLGDMISVYVRQMLIQADTPDTIRGRVSAVNTVFIGASNELGEFESGLSAEKFGLVHALLLGGMATLAITLLWAWRLPMLRRLDRFPHAAVATVPIAAASPVPSKTVVGGGK